MVASDVTTPAFVLGKGITALSVVQGIGRYSVPAYLLGSNKDDIAYHSRYVTPIDRVDVNDPDQIIDRLREMAASLGCKPVLLCCSDFYLQMVSENRDRFQEFCRLDLPSTEAVATVLNKGLFGDFCALNNLPAPRSWALRTADHFDECKTEARFPVAIKPVFSHKAKAENFQKNGKYASMILARDAAELARYYTELTGYGANLLVMEYIDGPDSEHYSYISYRNSESREVAGVGIRKIRVFPIHAGVGTFAEVTEDAELTAQSNNLLDKLNYRGISSVCFKRDMSTGKLMLHELNGRFPQPHSGSRLCGINLPYVAYRGALGLQADIQRVPAGSRKWILLDLDFQAFRHYRPAGELSTVGWLKSLVRVRVCTEFALDDMRPFLFFLRSTGRRLWARLFSSTNPADAGHQAPGRNKV
jgi:predicted ATP-grasp superfamily ATP-dependent carboligase